LTLWLWSSHVERDDMLEGQLGLHDALLDVMTRWILVNAIWVH